MISPQYFANILVQISPNNKKSDIFKIYTKWAVKKCPRWNFYACRKPRNSKNKSVYSIVGHPVFFIFIVIDEHKLLNNLDQSCVPW